MKCKATTSQTQYYFFYFLRNVPKTSFVQHALLIDTVYVNDDKDNEVTLCCRLWNIVNIDFHSHISDQGV